MGTISHDVILSCTYLHHYRPATLARNRLRAKTVLLKLVIFQFPVTRSVIATYTNTGVDDSRPPSMICDN